MKTTCPVCAEEIAAGQARCPLCGEALVARGEVLAWAAEGVPPDPTLAAKLPGWPDDSLERALRDHLDDYSAAQRRAIQDEAQRRGISREPPGGIRSRSGADIAAMLIGLCALVLLLLVAFARVWR